MDAAKDTTAAAADQNPTPNPPTAAAPPDDSAAAAAAGRRPFTSLTQEEADLALARVLQEQVKAVRRRLGISLLHHGRGGLAYPCFFFFFFFVGAGAGVHDAQRAPRRRLRGLRWWELRV